VGLLARNDGESEEETDEGSDEEPSSSPYSPLAPHLTHVCTYSRLAAARTDDRYWSRLARFRDPTPPHPHPPLHFDFHPHPPDISSPLRKRTRSVRRWRAAQAETRSHQGTLPERSAVRRDRRADERRAWRRVGGGGGEEGGGRGGEEGMVGEESRGEYGQVRRDWFCVVYAAIVCSTLQSIDVRRPSRDIGRRRIDVCPSTLGGQSLVAVTAPLWVASTLTRSDRAQPRTQLIPIEWERGTAMWIPQTRRR
jgi:hypothetical protein